MRRIKFRAWNGRSMEYGGFNVHATGKVQPESNLTLASKDSIVMQFTGLHDNSGKDIYEGDVVNDHIGRGEVEYSDKYAGFRVNYKNWLCKWFYDYNLRGERESIEVVGNIYNTQHLI